jgi:hypothetical protein
VSDRRSPCLLVEDDVAGVPGAEPHPVLVDATLLEQRYDHAGDTEGAHQPKGECSWKELTRAVPSALVAQRHVPRLERVYSLLKRVRLVTTRCKRLAASAVLLDMRTVTIKATKSLNPAPSYLRPPVRRLGRKSWRYAPRTDPGSWPPRSSSACAPCDHSTCSPPSQRHSTRRAHWAPRT